MQIYKKYSILHSKTSKYWSFRDILHSNCTENWHFSVPTRGTPRSTRKSAFSTDCWDYRPETPETAQSTRFSSTFSVNSTENALHKLVSWVLNFFNNLQDYIVSTVSKSKFFKTCLHLFKLVQFSIRSSLTRSRFVLTGLEYTRSIFYLALA